MVAPAPPQTPHTASNGATGVSRRRGVESGYVAGRMDPVRERRNLTAGSDGRFLCV